MRVYYAHPMSWYNTHHEQADVERLEALGHSVLNPNDPYFARKVQDLRSRGLGHMVMEPFMKAVTDCDAVAYRPFMDGKLGAGVAKEVLEGLVQGKPVFHVMTPERQCHGLLLGELLTIVQTRARIMEGTL